MTDDKTRIATDHDDHFVALHSGFALGKYELQAVLGQGGFGITYKAWDAALSRAVAIKEYLPSDVAVRVGGSTVRAKSRNDEESFQWGLERFLEEARALARFETTPSIVRVYDYMLENGTAYMVMALIEGTPLSLVYRREAPLSEERLKAIVLPILDGLDDVHHAGFLHRDIKPANILIRPNGAPVLIDFGAARQALGERSRSITSVFTPGYAPFEQYTSSGKQGAWTDIYALAATLYHGISGKAPPQATDRIREDPMEPAVRIGAGQYARHFLEAIDAGLEVFENRRPQTIAQWRDMLSPPQSPYPPIYPGDTARTQIARPPDPATAVPTLDQRGQPLQGATTPKPPDPVWLGGGQKRRSRVPLIAASVALVLLAGGGYAAWNAMETGRVDSEQRLKIESDARAKAEQQAAQLQAREAARLKAEEEAKAKTDAEQRARQEAESRAREAADAKRRAEEERRAEEQARRKAADDAKAEAEAKRKADADRRKADDDARAKVDTDTRRVSDSLARARADLERLRGNAPSTPVQTQVTPPPPVSSADVAPPATQQAAAPAYAYAGVWNWALTCPNAAVSPFLSAAVPINGPSFDASFYRDGKVSGEIAGTSMKLQMSFTSRSNESFKGSFSLNARSATEFSGGGIVSGFIAGATDRNCSVTLTR